jgi:SAM-dependent methyltransferase
VLFDQYLYFSSYSTTMVDAMRELARRMTAGLNLGHDSLVVDIGSNDGYLLKHYLDAGVGVLGIDPAHNVAAVATEAGVPTVVAYFGARTARQVRASYGPADVIHANNVMAHVPDVNDFVAGLAMLLSDGGTIYVESPYLGRLVDDMEFDTIYHEHVYYYSLTAIDRIVRRHGLCVTDIEELPVHGGSLRYAIRRSGSTASAVSAAVVRLMAAETAAGLHQIAYYRDFAANVARLRLQARSTLYSLKGAGARIAAYGAAAKGTVLLNHFGVGADLIDFVVDRNPHKQGMFMPGVGIPIVDPAALVRQRPTHVLLLAWNLAQEIIGQQQDYVADGGRFVIPIPEIRVL